MTKSEKDKINKALMKNELSSIKQMFNEYDKALDEIRKDMSKIAEKYSVNGKLTYAEMSKYNRLQSLEENIFSDMLNVYNTNKKLTEKLMSQQYGESFYRHYFQLNKEAGMDINFGLLSKDKIKAAVENPLEKIAQNGIKTNGLNSIRRTITADLIKGSSYDEMMNDISDFIEADKNRLLTIVRTEGQRAQILGSQACYDDLIARGINLIERWLATIDGAKQHDPPHQSMDGVEREKKGWFFPGIGWVAGPLQSGIAAFDINCRCDILAEILGFPTKYRRVPGEGIDKFKTYDEWAKYKKVA